MQVSLYGGVVGDIVRHFVRPRTVLGSLPALVVTGLLASGAGALVEHARLPASFALIVMLIALSPVLALYAVPARHGDWAAGMLAARSYPRQTLAFVRRYVLAIVLWGLPFASLVAWLTHQGAQLSPHALSMVSAGWLGIGVMVAWLGALVMHFVALVVALRAEGTADVLAPGAWLWTLRERRADLASMLAGAFGGTLVFALGALPTLTALALLASRLDARLGAIVAAAAYVVPVSSAPMLIGRMAGALVFTNGVELNAEGSGVAAPARERSRPKRNSDAPALAELHQLAETNPLKALLEAEQMLQADPENLAIAVEIAVLLDAVGSRERALKQAAQTIVRSLEHDEGEAALELYQYFVHDRQHLGLSADTCDGLSRVALAHERFDDALWCICAAESAGLAATRAQKRIIAIADAAAQAGQLERAVTYYQFFEGMYPDSPFSDYCRRAIESHR